MGWDETEVEIYGKGFVDAWVDVWELVRRVGWQEEG